MKGIIGIDETRPPKIRKEPYIDISFKLSHQAPIEWCKDLNALLNKQVATANTTITEKEGTFIKTWVRTSDEIISLVEQIKLAIVECTHQYIERIQLAAQNSGDADTSKNLETGEQANLNRIIASLDFDEGEKK